MPDRPMSALTVRQPFASAIVFGSKDVENRSWAASYRGRLLIHAGLGEDAAPDEAWAADEEHGSPRGLIIGHVRLLDCTRLRTDSSWAMPGAVHWLLACPVALREPVPCKGRQGLWTVPDDAAAAVLAQLEDR